MKVLENCIQEDYEKINANLDSDLKDYLVFTAVTLRDVAKNQKLKIAMPKDLKSEVRIFDRSDFSFDENELARYYEDRDFNIALSSLGDSIYEEYDFSCPQKRYRSKIDINETIRIVGEFFKSYDKDLYDYFENFVINGKFFPLKGFIRGYNGLTVQKSLYTEPYVFMKKSNNVVDIFTLAHEIIHAYLSEKVCLQGDDEYEELSDSNLDEVYSCYMEIIMSEYLDSINYSPKDIAYFIDDFNALMLDDLIDYSTYLDVEPEFSDPSVYNEYSDLEIYSRGKVIGYNFFNQYLADRDMAKENITRFMLERMKHTLKYMLNHYGLSEEEIVDKRVLVKAMNHDE